ncbi:MAG TPA: hypothetical protein VJV79_39595 [Polyangiaceae bacterium]|nr:hypothetical protein [Polyangiaceae bacterium]
MSGARLRLLLLLLLLLLEACSAPRVAHNSLGVSVKPGPCGRGLVVVQSDYQSSNVSLLGFDGQVLSESLVSSSTESSGFGVALSGDVVTPSTPQDGPEIVLIDRYPAGVLRFVDLATARITTELSVATGFRANPQDYLSLAPERAYVARYEANPNAGRQAWDAGGDILIVDPSVPAITGRIDLAAALAGEPAKFSAHPARLLNASGRVFALLAAYSDDYSSGTWSRLVEIDPETDALVSTLVIDGLRGCTAMAISPDGVQLAVACTGDDFRNDQPKLEGSGLALLDIAGTPRLEQRFEASALGDSPLGFGLDYAAPGVLLFNTLGHFEASGALGAEDSLLRLDTATGQVEALLRSAGEPFTLGGARCAMGCGVCFAADAKRAGGSVLRFTVDALSTFAAPTTIRAETRIGLPPRYLGWF